MGTEALDLQDTILDAVFNDSDERFMNRISDLLRAGTLPAGAPFLPLTGHETAEVRRRSIFLLSQIGGEGVVEALCARLADESELVRASAVSSLGRLQAQEAVEPLVDLFRTRTDDQPLLKAVAEALGKIGDPVALAPLQEASRSAASVTVRSACMMAASKLQARARASSRA